MTRDVWVLALLLCGCGPGARGSAPASTERGAAEHASGEETSARLETGAADAPVDPSIPTGGAEPGAGEPAPPAGPDTAAALAPGATVDLCGRWRLSLPEGAGLEPGDPGEGGAPPAVCFDPGYEGPLDTHGVAGVEIHLSVRALGCEVWLEGHDQAPAAAGPGPSAGLTVEVTSVPTGARLAATAPDRGALALSITAEGGPPECTAVAQAVARLAAETLEPRPLAAGGAVHLTLSSAGHGMDLTLPAGLYVVSLGGMADAFETAYELRAADGHALLTVYTAWDPEVGDDVPVLFRPTILASRPRRVTEPELYDGWERCAATATLTTGPEARIVTDLYFCGTRAENRATEAILRAGRFTPRHPESAP